MKTGIISAVFLLVGSSLGAQTADPELSLLNRDVPSVDADVADLGRLLFFDSRLSGDASTACSDCHDPNFGWTDGTELSRGYPGTKHWRNAQTIVNVGYLGSGFHRDSGLPSLSAQVLDAMGAGFVANIDTVLAEERLRQIPAYVDLFEAIWGEAPTMPRIAEAIAEFERSLVSNDSPYDQFMAGQSADMSQSALRGMELFNGKANCSSCHSGALTTDAQFHNTTVPPNLDLSEDPLRQVTFRYLMRRLEVDPSVSASLDRDPGRYLVTKDPADLGKFRTPDLRYLKYTAPYMHSGVFYTLDEVVDFYNSGGTPDVFGTKASEIEPLNLSQGEREDLVAFLESLSGSEVTMEVPDLPSYEVQSFPASSSPLSFVSLDTNSADPTATSTGTEPGEPGSIELRPRGAAGSETAPASDTAAPIETASTAPEATSVADGVDRIKQYGGERYVVIEPGDTLKNLAELIYGDSGRSGELFDANRTSLRAPEDIRVGMLLVIP